MLPSPPAHLIRAPRISPLVQPRPRLALARSRFDLTEVWASAGAGKTTLLALWARELGICGETAVWVSLPAAGAADFPLALLTQAAVARHRLQAPAGAGREGPVDAVGPYGLDGLSNLRGDVTLIFDDLHHLTGRADGQWFADLIESRPDGLRLVLAGRFPPPVLARRRLRRETTEYRTGDLAFTREETNGFFAARGVQLAPEQIDAVTDRTDGWAAALTLFSSLLRTSGLTAGWPPDHDAGQRTVADYLAGEILAQLPAPYRNFLFTSSVVDTITAPLAEHLTQRRDAGRILDQLAGHTGLLTQGEAPDGAPAYTFQPILLGYLRAEFRRRDFSAYARAVAAAAAWHSGHGDTVLGLKIIQGSGVPGDIRAYLDRHGLELFFRGAGGSIQQALTAAGGDGNSSAAAHVLQALMTAPYFPDGPRADYHLAAAESSLGAQPLSLRLVHSTLVVLRAPLAGLAESLRRLAALSDDSCQAEDAGDGPALHDALLFSRLGQARFHTARADFVQAAGILAEALQASRFSNHRWLHLILLEAAATAYARAGRWPEALELQDEMAGMSPAGDQPQSLVEAQVQLAVAEAAFHRLEDGRNAAHLEELVAWVEHLPAPGITFPARALQLVDRIDAATGLRGDCAALDRLLRVHSAAQPLTLAVCVFSYVNATLQLCERHRVGEAMELVQAVLGPHSLESVLAGALCSAGAGRTTGAEETLEHALGTAAAWHPATRVSAWIQLAGWAEQSGRDNAADSRILRAVETAEQSHLRRPFIANYALGARLVRSRLGRLGAADSFARTVVAAAGHLTPDDATNYPNAAYLSPKEREILRELPLYQSVHDIAARQRLSPNTVKTHMRSIYRKLGVTGRAEAVRQAAGKGLL